MFSRKNQKVCLVGSLFDYGGYACMNREIFDRLYSLGWNMLLETVQGSIEIEKDRKEWFDSFRCFENSKPKVYSGNDLIKIFAYIPLVNVPKYKKNIIYTMTETKEPSPSFVNRCNKYYDELWTPTEWNRQSLIKAGLNIQSKKIPIGISDLYSSDVKNDNSEPINLKYIKYGKGNKDPEGFCFLSVFRWSYRKGFDVLVKSFLQEFTQDDGVYLLIHSRHAAMSHEKTFYDYVENDLKRLVTKFSKSNSAPIYLSMDIVTEKMMPKLYAKSNCFVSCSRGEGLCLPVLENAKMKIPVICPNHTGFSDYVSDERTFSFPVDEWVVCDTVQEWRKGGWITDLFRGQKFPLFGDKTVKEVQELMRYVYNNPKESKIRSDNFKKFIDKNYNWDIIIKNIDNRLIEIYNENIR